MAPLWKMSFPENYQVDFDLLVTPERSTPKQDAGRYPHGSNANPHADQYVARNVRLLGQLFNRSYVVERNLVFSRTCVNERKTGG